MFAYPPELEAYVQGKIASGEFTSRDDFAVEAAKVYRDLEEQARELRDEVQARLKRAGQGVAQPLDREALKQDARRRFVDGGTQG